MREVATDMGIEIMAQGIGKNQPVINLLRHLFIDEGAVAFTECGAQGVCPFIVTHAFKCAGLDIRHNMETSKGADLFPASAQ